MKEASSLWMESSCALALGLWTRTSHTVLTMEFAEGQRKAWMSECADGGADWLLCEGVTTPRRCRIFFALHFVLLLRLQDPGWKGCLPSWTYL
ncbi:Olfactory Receptor 2Y1 [Manis pentadactyla]|nr:Olfactory Receptor 2Y1 [Manis pentadactyla]